ncbi:hypothetical protein E4U38_007436 [Claviceps purpurea]|nr:hypothetical protein E4U38_007436 [Claviceps purpurea]
MDKTATLQPAGLHIENAPAEGKAGRRPLKLETYKQWFYKVYVWNVGSMVIGISKTLIDDGKYDAHVDLAQFKMDYWRLKANT